MAHTKAQKAAKGNRDSRSKRLGIKKYGGQLVKIGNIIIRQKGSKIYPGEGTKMGKDYTIYAVKQGLVEYYQRLGRKYVRIINRTNKE